MKREIIKISETEVILPYHEEILHIQNIGFDFGVYGMMTASYLLELVKNPDNIPNTIRKNETNQKQEERKETAL